jgi:iron(III) transport system substrate-binding protein
VNKPLGSAQGRFTRRQFLAASAAVAGSTLADTRMARAASSTDALYAAAKKEGRLVWWCGFLDRTGMGIVQNAFMAEYPGIKVDALWQTGEVVYTRIQQNLKAKVHDVDVFATSNAGHWPILKRQNALAPYQTADSGAISKVFQNVDPDHAFRAAGVEMVVIDYRTDKVDTPPSKWTDFLDPKWDNKITLGSPAFSGNAANWTLAMLDKYGDRYLTELARRNPKMGRSILGTGTDIVAGERLVGHAQDANTFSLHAAGNPINVKYPEDDAILALGYTGILKTGPNPNAARLFMEFLDSRAYSEALTKTFHFPIRSDVKSFNGLTMDSLKTYQSSIERLTTGTPEAIAKWHAAMGI